MQNLTAEFRTLQAFLQNVDDATNMFRFINRTRYYTTPLKGKFHL